MSLDIAKCPLRSKTTPVANYKGNLSQMWNNMCGSCSLDQKITPTINRRPPGGLTCPTIINDLLQVWRAIITHWLLVLGHGYQVANLRITAGRENNSMGGLESCSGTQTSLWVLMVGIRTKDSKYLRNKSFQWSHWPAQAVPTLKNKAPRTALGTPSY